MSIELSPSQERRLHSILDRGLEALHDNRESLDSPGMRLESEYLGSMKSSPRKEYSPSKQTDKNCEAEELRLLRERLMMLEAKVLQTAETPSVQSSKRNNQSPGPSIRKVSHSSSRASRESHPIQSSHHSQNSNISHTSNASRSSSAQNRSALRSHSRERIRNLESSEKELVRLEKSINQSPARRKTLSNSRQIEKVRVLVEKERKLGEKLRKENESLRKELNKREELKAMITRLQDEYNELAQSFERSEAVRKKQKELILQLKVEINQINGGQALEYGTRTKKKGRRQD